MVCTGFLHLLGDMTVYIQSKGGGVVAQILLHRLNVIAALEGGNGVRMPLWHNKDKSENPCVATGWRFVLILFPLKNGPKTGSTGGGEKPGLHLKDKFFWIAKEAKSGFPDCHYEI